MFSHTALILPIPLIFMNFLLKTYGFMGHGFYFTTEQNTNTNKYLIIE